MAKPTVCLSNGRVTICGSDNSTQTGDIALVTCHRCHRCFREFQEMRNAQQQEDTELEVAIGVLNKYEHRGVSTWDFVPWTMLGVRPVFRAKTPPTGPKIPDLTAFEAVAIARAYGRDIRLAGAALNDLHLKCLGCNEAAPGDRFDSLRSIGWWWTPPSISPDYPYLWCPECFTLLRDAMGISDTAALKEAIKLLTLPLGYGNPITHATGDGGSCNCRKCRAVRLAVDIAERAD